MRESTVSKSGEGPDGSPRGRTARYDRILERARQGGGLCSDDIRFLLAQTDPVRVGRLFAAARRLRQEHFDDRVFLYGFVYFSTFCRNDCAFCQHRRSNSAGQRHRKTAAGITGAARLLADEGVHLIDLTMGEDPRYFEDQPSGFDRLAEKIRGVKSATGLPVMISPGVLPREALRQMAHAGADFALPLPNGTSPLKFAVLHDDVAAAESLHLCSRNRDILLTKDSANRPLAIQAVKNKQYSIAELFIRPLHYIVKRDRPEYLARLLEVEKRLLRQKDEKGMAPLHIAYLYRNRRFIEWLIAAGADEKALDSYGKKPADYLTESFVSQTEINLLDDRMRIKIDDRSEVTPGFKFNDWEMRGVPIRLEIGPKDVEKGSVALARRDIPGREGKSFVPQTNLAETVNHLLTSIQDALLKRATEFRDANIHEPKSYEELKNMVEKAYQAPLTGILPLNFELADNASKDLFSLRFPDHPWSKELRKVAAAILEVQ